MLLQDIKNYMYKAQIKQAATELKIPGKKMNKGMRYGMCCGFVTFLICAITVPLWLFSVPEIKNSYEIESGSL